MADFCSKCTIFGGRGGENTGQRGVGFVKGEEWRKKLREFKGKTNRIVGAKFESRNEETITIRREGKCIL